MKSIRLASKVLTSVLPVICLCLAGPNAFAAGGFDGGKRLCPAGDASVQGADGTDFVDICSGVKSAMNFLAAHGIRPAEPIDIDVTASIPEEAGPTATGCYIEQKRRIYVVPYAVFRKNKTWFGVSITRELYRTLAAHEAAHAVVSCQFRVQRPTIQAKEYVAYVAMFSSMSPTLQRQALRGTRTEGFETLDRFTPLLYMFDPMRFGAEAYRHFSSVANRTELLQDILAGRALAE